MIKKTPYSSWAIKGLPKGCRFCVEGEKLVLFITGKCSRKCYYCPLPEGRIGKDVVWANERMLSNPDAVNEAIEEAEKSGAKGMGITGGDPLLVVERVCKYVKNFKKRFGKRFHVHIYLPTLLVTEKNIEKLAKSGIDEVRFHPEFLNFDNVRIREKEILKINLANKIAKKYKWEVGCEIPVIPKTERKIIYFVDSIKNYISFLNLNELETSVLNAPFLISRGFRIYPDSAVKGSKESALAVLKWADRNVKNAKLKNIHYCSAATKNLFQYKNRLRRRLKNIFKPYNMITKDDTLYRAAIYMPSLKPDIAYAERLRSIKTSEKQKIIKKLEKMREKLMKKFQIPSKLVEIDKERLRILTSVEIAKKIGQDIKVHGLDVAFVEELPTYDSQILQLEWL